MAPKTTYIESIAIVGYFHGAFGRLEIVVEIPEIHHHATSDTSVDHPSTHGITQQFVTFRLNADSSVTFDVPTVVGCKVIIV